MRAKMIRDRRKSSQTVEASVEIHGEQVAEDLEAFFADKLEPEEGLPSFLDTLRFFQKLLAAGRRHMVDAASRHLEQIDGDNTIRRRRNQLNNRLETKGRRLRNVLDGLFGDGSGLEIAGIDRRAAQEPVDLLAQTERIIERFGQLDGESRRPELMGFAVNPQELIDDLVPDYRELAELVGELNRENRKVERTLIAKDKAVADYDVIFRLVANSLAALYRIAGHDELAQRVIPGRRPGQTRGTAEGTEGEPGEAAEARAPEAGESGASEASGQVSVASGSAPAPASA